MKRKRQRVDLTRMRRIKLANSFKAKLLKQFQERNEQAAREKDSQRKWFRTQPTDVFPQPAISEWKIHVASETEDRKTEGLDTREHTAL
jgi:hypothetical protein